MFTPKVKLSSAQWKELLTRLFEREKGFTEKVSEEVMKYEPPTEKTFGALQDLNKPRGLELGWPELQQRVMGPVEDINKMYAENPENYAIPRGALPPMDRLAVGTEPSSNTIFNPEEPFRNLAYERIKFQKPEMINPEVLNEGVMRAEGIKIPLSPATQGAGKTISEARVIWKEILGGNRGMAGKLWGNIFERARLKRHYKKPQDYFEFFFDKWKRSTPEQLEKAFPRETKFMQTIENLIGSEGEVGQAESLADMFKKRIA